MKFEFIKYRKFYYAFSAVLIIASLLALVLWGVNPGIEFVGGSVIEVEYSEERPTMEVVESQLAEINLTDANIQFLGENGLIIRTGSADENIHRNILIALEGADEKYFESIGPAIGEELKRASFIAIIIASLLVIIYIAISFREDDGSVNSWKYGTTAAGVAFLHDILIVIGVFSLLGYLYGVQLTIPIAVALLTTLGYSINDTVVIFDRIRENLRENKSGKDSLEIIIDKSLNQTIGRSLGTSITTLLVLFSLLFLVGGVLYYFILALILGVIFGTYSSIFLAGCLIFDWNNLTRSKK